jgi:putative transcriptional regulator
MPVSRNSAHASDALLASYAAGSLSHPLHALVAAHLAIKPDSRSYVRALETVLAQDLETEAPDGPVADRGRRLAGIFSDKGDTGLAYAGDGVLPGPLAAYVGSPLDSLGWRARMPGLKEVKLEDRHGCEASLLWIKAGRAMPSHTHHGMEVTLVLKGSFSDAVSSYGRGDICVVDSDVDHKPRAGLDGDCICFAVSEGPVTLTGPVARLFSKLLGH